MRRTRSRALLLTTLALAASALAACGSTSTPPATTATTSPATAAGLPPIGHVFVIVLENQSYAATFGPGAADPYLATTLTGQGALLQNYDGIGHFSNDNYIALLSGQPPNPSTSADCLTFANFPPTAGQVDGIQQGNGCVYPTAVPTLAGQLSAKGLTWKGYMQDMGNIPTRESTTCGHPAIGAFDATTVATSGDGYATRHDPFVYFHSIIDDTTTCGRQVVPLGTTTGTLPAGTPPYVTGLASDLKSVTTTPNLSFITPNLCQDGHDFPCKSETGGSSAYADTDAFLQQWVPLITSSAAFKTDGLLIVTYDESETNDSSSCCGQTPGPAQTAAPAGAGGGGRVGAVLLSPFVKPGTTTTVAYNHYATLATIEKLFGLPALGEARTVTSTFGKDVFTAAPG